MKVLIVLLFLTCAFVSPAHAQTPTLVHHVGGGQSPGTSSITSYTLPSVDPAQAGNTFIVSVDMPAGASVTVTDDKSDSFSQLLCNVNGSSKVCSYCATPLTAGARVITVTPGAPTAGVGILISEFNNLSCTLDGSSGNSGTGATISSGSFTSATPGDLIYQFTLSDSAVPTSWTQGSGFAKLSSQPQDGQYAQYLVQGTPGAINPTHSFAGTINWNTIGFALKAKTAGSPLQSGIRVVRIQQNNFDNSRATYALDFPCTGNLLVAAIPGSNTSLNSITDSNGNTWKVDLNSGGTLLAHAQNAICSTTMTVTVNFAAAVSQTIAMFYDVKGAAASAYDSTCSTTAAGNQPGSPGTFNGTTVTPSTSNGLVISTLGLDNNYIADMPGPPGALYDTGNPLPFIPIDSSYENNGWGHAYYSSTSPITIQWTTANGPGALWDNVTACFEAPAGSQPTVAIAPPSVAFGNVQVGAVGPITDIQISNASTNGDSLTINSFATSGGNPGDFFAVAPASSSPACNLSTPTTVTPGTSCFVGVNFKPTAAGPRSSSLIFGDNAAGGQGSVPLSGSGTSSTAASIAATAGTSQSAKINTAYATTLQATAKDSGGTGISGVSVTFTAPVSGASGTFSGVASVTVTTDTSGIASAPAFAANSTAGTFAVNATTPGVNTPAVFTLTNTPGSAATIAAAAGTPQSAAIGAPFATLQAIVRDTGGNGVARVTVTFTAPATGASGTFPGVLATASAVTDSSGLASAPTFTANATVGSYSVNATVVGLASPATFSLTNLGSAPASITASSGTPQSVVISTAFAALKAAVKDTGGNAVSGATVTFTAPATGASGTFAGGAASAAVVTDASGIATAPTFTANTTAGSYTVNAKVAGVATPAAFTLTNLPGVPTVSTLSPTSATAGGTAFTLTVNGTKFAATSVVNFNGAAKSTTFISASQLTAAITAADIANVGVVNVNVSTPAPGGGVSTNLTFTISNPQPILVSLSPASATAGSAAFTLTVNGSGFVSGATVSFKGAAKTTTFVSSTVLTAAITAADVNSAGAASVGVTNPGPTGGTSLTLTFMINNPQPAIATATSSGKTHAPGGAALTLVVSGTGFLPASVVNFGAKAEPTTFVSTTQITAAIPASDVAIAGSVNVSVTNPAPGGGTSAPGTVLTVDGYAVTGPATASTVAAGQQTTIQLTVTPGAKGFTNAVGLSVSGLPANTTATLSPTSVTPNGASATATLTILTTARGAAAPPPSSPRNMPLPPWLMPALALCLAALLAGRFMAPQLRSSPSARRYAAIVPLVLLLIAGGVLSGCSGITAGPKNTNGTPPGTSQLTVSATSGTMAQNATVTLTVQ